MSRYFYDPRNFPMPGSPGFGTPRTPSPTRPGPGRPAPPATPTRTRPGRQGRSPRSTPGGPRSPIRPSGPRRGIFPNTRRPPSIPGSRQVQNQARQILGRAGKLLARAAWLKYLSLLEQMFFESREGYELDDKWYKICDVGYPFLPPKYWANSGIGPGLGCGYGGAAVPAGDLADFEARASTPGGLAYVGWIMIGQSNDVGIVERMGWNQQWGRYPDPDHLTNTTEFVRPRPPTFIPNEIPFAPNTDPMRIPIPGVWTIPPAPTVYGPGAITTSPPDVSPTEGPDSGYTIPDPEGPGTPPPPPYVPPYYPDGPVIGTPGEPVIPNVPPRGSTVERKGTIFAPGGAGALVQGTFHAITEGMDVLDSLYDALPEDCRKGSSTPQGKAIAIYNCYERMSLSGAIENLIKNYIEDNAVGRLNAATNRGMRNARNRGYLPQGGFYVNPGLMSTTGRTF